MGFRTVTGFFCFSLLLFLGGCTTIHRFPENDIDLDGWKDGEGLDAFTHLERELSMIAETERIGAQEMVVRLPAANLFGVGEYLLQPGAEHKLMVLTGLLSKHRELLIIVEGHTDSRGSESYNQWLSERRSRVIADFLVNSGLDPDTIQVVGYGESYPLISGNSPEAVRRNRRIELHISPIQF